MKSRGVIVDARIGIPFPGKHLMRSLKLSEAAGVKETVSSSSSSDHEVDVAQFVRSSVSSPLSSNSADDTRDTEDYLDDYSATALVEKRRRELCLWIEALLWRYPNLLKVL
jgi:hypothetical protein